MTSITANSHYQDVSSKELIPLLTRYQLLPQLLRERVIDQAIESIQCSYYETEQACQQLCQQYQLTSDDLKTSWLVRHGLSLEQFESLATRSLRLDRFKQSMWGNKLKSHFLRNKGKYDQAIYSMVRVSDLGVAQELFYRLEAQEQSFADIAEHYAEGEERLTGGLVGPVALGKLPHQLAQILVLSQPGKLWPPFQIKQWYLIIRLERMVPCQFDVNTQQLIMNELFEAWMKTQLSNIHSENQT